MVEATVESDPSDATTFLVDEAQREMFEANFSAGLMQDEKEFYEMTVALWDWGFDLEDVRQPFDVFYGDPTTSSRRTCRGMSPPAFPRPRPTCGPARVTTVSSIRDHWAQFLGAVNR